MRIRLLTTLLLTGAVVVGAGCVEYRVVGSRSPWDSLPWDEKEEAGQPGNGLRRPAMGYTVELMAFQGADRHQKLRDMVQQTRTQTDLADLRVTDIDGRAILQLGRFRDVSGLDARFALRQARDATIDGEAVFRDATLVPIGGGVRPNPGGPLTASIEDTVDPWNLRQFVGYYSLQIGYYDAEFTAGRRDAAEQAVKVLRESGDEAYYYHGPHRSMVCIGLFTDEDFQTVDGVQVYGDHIRELQTRFPHNLGNGRTLIEHRGELTSEQESCLVRVF